MIRTLLFLMLANIAAAQPLILETFIEDYESIEGTVITFPGGWSGSEKTVDLNMPFPAKLGLDTYSFIKVTSLGKAYGGAFRADFFAFHTFLKGAPESVVSWQVEGEAPNRVVRIQYKDVGFTYDTQGDLRASFQLLFYEDGCFESRMGPSNIDSVNLSALFGGYSGPIIGYYRASDDYAGFLDGDPASPTLNTIAESEAHLIGVPVEGQVYRFCADSTMGLEKLRNTVNVRMIANRAIVETPENGQWNGFVTDLSGKLIQYVRFSGTSTELDLPYAGGLYVLYLESTGGRVHRAKLVHSRY